MATERPDPDLLLSWVRSEEERRGPGRLKVYLGYAPGVGKTWDMLENAQSLRRAGVDVVAGCVVTHGRPETTRLLDGLESLPLQRVDHGGVRLEEFDLASALGRRPTVLLVDELAHTNAPGSRHPKRWHDVLDLLDAGIEVHTTLNIQHLDSLGAAVERITGVRVRETVPDAILERADEIRLVDLPPDELLQRLREGRVYLPEQARLAMERFFRRGNLLALRELALRRAAERVDQDVQAWRRESNVQASWPTSERVMACVGPGPGSEQVVRAAHRLSRLLGAPWLAVYAEPLESMPEADEVRRRLDAHLELADALGAEVVRLADPAVGPGLLRYARSRNVSRIVLGKPPETRWPRWSRSPVEDLLRNSGELEIHLVAGLPTTPPPPGAGGAGWGGEARSVLRWLLPGRLWTLHPWRGLGWAAALVAAATGVGLAGGGVLSLPDVVLLFLTAVLVTAVRHGRAAGLAAAFLSVLAFNFFFIPPYRTLRVDSPRHLLTFAVLFATGWLANSLVLRLRLREESSRRREERTACLLALSRDMAGVVDAREASRRITARAVEAFGGTALLAAPGADGGLDLLASSLEDGGLSPMEDNLASLVVRHARPAGAGTDTLPGLPSVCHPLVGQAGVIAVLVVREGSWIRPDREGRSFQEAWLRQAGLLLDRARLAQDARDAGLRAQREELRSSLLSSVSHDLRTPLSVITTAATTLRDSGDRLDETQRRDMLEALCAESIRMERLVGNLLDMMRLESGGLAPRLEWVPLDEILGPVLDRLATRLGDRTVRVEIPPDLPLLRVDPVLLEQLATNLLDNALKYTPPDSPLGILARMEDGWCRVEFRDQGPGLPTPRPEVVFEKFWRGTGWPGGSGLGLAICRGIAQAHGGALVADNPPDGGARFTLTLPLEPAPDCSLEGALPEEESP